MHRMVYPFLPAFGRGLGVDLAALSLALTMRSMVGAVGPLLASMADSRGRKAAMLFGLLLFTAGVGIVAIWPTYLSFLLALVLSTLGKYLFDPSMQAYLGDRVSYQRRGFVLAFTEIGWSFSFILGVPVMGLVIAWRGWISPFPLLAMLGLLSVGLLNWLLPDDSIKAGSQPGLWTNFRNVLTYPPALAGLMVGFFMSTANEVINLVFGVWLEDAFGLRIAALGAASLVIGMSELGGESLVGMLVDRLGKPRSVAVGLLLNGIAALFLPVLGQNLPGALTGLFLFFLTFEFTLVSSIPLMTEILPTARATLMAANVAGLSLGRALGASLAPPLYLLGATPGMSSGAVVAVIFNLCALFALYHLHRAMKLSGAREI